MFKFIQKRKDYKKCLSVMYSCKTFGELSSALNLVYNYGRTYGFEYYWRELDSKGFVLYMNHLDNIEYQERLKEVNE